MREMSGWKTFQRKAEKMKNSFVSKWARKLFWIKFFYEFQNYLLTYPRPDLSEIHFIDIDMKAYEEFELL